MTVGKRFGIKPSLRFRVLKRDNFACRYCGRGPRESVLHIDHVKPVDAGGTNDIDNLRTACVDCNLGKGSDDCFITREEHDRVLADVRENHGVSVGHVALEVLWHRLNFGSDEDGGTARHRVADEAITHAMAAGMNPYHVTHYALRDYPWEQWLEVMGAALPAVAGTVAH